MNELYNRSRESTLESNYALQSADSPRRLDRRALFAGGAAIGAAAVLPSTSWVHAQDSMGTIQIGFDGSNQTVRPFVEATAEELASSNPNASVQVEASAGGSYATQLVLQLNRGQGPDVFLLSGVAVAELAEAGLVAPLTDFVANWDDWSEYRVEFRATVTYAGDVWAIPYPMDTHFLYYRRDLFAGAGLPDPWNPETPADILQAALTIKGEYPDAIPYALYAGANGGNSTVARGFVPLVHAYGGTLMDDDGLWIIDSCAIRDALTFYEQAFQVDQVVPQDVMTGASPPSAMRQAMGDGTLGILYEGSWTYQPWLEDDPESTEANIGLAFFPTADDREPFAVGGTGNCWYINASSKHPDLAWRFIEAFNAPANQVALNLVDPHIPARSDAASDPSFQRTEFLSAMVASADVLLLADPDPAFRELITIVQNATGIVATGEADSETAVERYASELTRVLSEGNVVRQTCPR
ncbi:ABC transporter substrate-binding protein [soil metagenome]